MNSPPSSLSTRFPIHLFFCRALFGLEEDESDDEDPSGSAVNERKYQVSKKNSYLPHNLIKSSCTR
jgi:hypothetical protein